MTAEEALRLIAYSTPTQMLEWAQKNNVDLNIIKGLKSYGPKWQATAEYRGGLVHVHREIARRALPEDEKPGSEYYAEMYGLR